jgi:GH24 family phage-related lysozyme (muramidase)
MKNFLIWLNEQNDTEYNIQSGDTITALAKKNNTTVENIMKLNPSITDPNMIKIGQKLNLPSNQQVISNTTTPQTTASSNNQQNLTKQEPKAPQPPAWHSLISKFEGMRTKAYWDPTGKLWTIGKGSTTHPDGRPVKQGDVITPEQANENMQRYVDTRILPVYEKKIPTWNKLNPNQQSALISFGYNVGPNFYGSKGFETISKCLSCEQNLSGVPAALNLYNKSGGEVLTGLQNRRKAEGDLWSTSLQQKKQDSEGRESNLGTATDEEITSPQFLKPQNKK